jgi:GT2 family glycosyltransferase
VASEAVVEATNRPSTTFVIVNWNRRALLEGCLRSLEQQTILDFEVVLVDNGSTDGSLECLAQFPSLSITVIRNQENRGFAPAVNQGIRQARGRFIALINNDVVLDKQWLGEMVASLSAHPGVGMCAAKILFAQSPQLIDKAGHVIYPDGQNYGRGHLEVDHGQYDRPEEVLCPDGAAAVYRTEVFESAGLFDEDFFAYGDDAELGLRAQICGWNCLYVPTAIAYHHRSSTLGEYAPEKIFLVERNRIWLALKLFPWRQLVQAPLYSAVRCCYSFRSLVTRQGDVGRAARQGLVWRTLGAVLRAEFAATLRSPRMLGKRREVNRRRQISAREFGLLLRRHQISARELTR